MKFKLNNNSIHHICLIEYHCLLPFSMITKVFIENASNGSYWRPYFWEVFIDKDTDILNLYNHGDGGELLASLDYIKPDNHSFWATDDIQINNPRNLPRLEKPLLLKGLFAESENPFLVGEIAESYHYCTKCNAPSEELCYEHFYFDDNGDIRWKSNHKYYQM